MTDNTEFENTNEKSVDSVRALKNEIFDWVQNIALILTAIVLIFIFIIRIIGVDGESMVPTLHDKDWLIISGMFYKPQTGDIIVLAKNSFLDGKQIVKRIIATEGQKVDIDFEKGIVYVDDVALDEPYIAEPTHRQLGMTFPVQVPEDSVFVMGDNRNHSSDSRDSSLGTVHKNYILGKLLVRILPLNRFGLVQ